MGREKTLPVGMPCLCGALREASRAVSRLYDEELRSIGLRTTQYSLLRHLSRVDEVRQRDLAGLTLHDETSLIAASPRWWTPAGWPSGPGRTAARSGSRSPPLGWRSSRKPGPPGSAAGADPARLPERTWRGLMEILPVVAKLSAGS